MYRVPFCGACFFLSCLVYCAMLQYQRRHRCTWTSSYFVHDSLRQCLSDHKPGRMKPMVYTCQNQGVKWSPWSALMCVCVCACAACHAIWVPLMGTQTYSKTNLRARPRDFIWNLLCVQQSHGYCCIRTSSFNSPLFLRGARTEPFVSAYTAVWQRVHAKNV